MTDHTDYFVEETQTDYRTIGQTVVKGRATGLRASLRQTPVVGDRVNELFEVEAALGDRRFTVVHPRFEHRFELRLLKDVDQEFRTRATDASLTSNSNLGVIVDARECPIFGAYAVIEARKGMELSDMLDDGMHSIDGALRFAISVGSALAALHENGVTHGMLDFRDIVCGNDGEWILCAAGLPPVSGAIAPFRAPESVRAADVTPRSDQWVLAAAIYRMLSGKTPQADTTQRTGQRRPGVPSDVDDALLRALKKDPEERFATIDQLVGALQSSFFVWRQPSMVPVDAREISRLLKMHPDVATGFDRGATRQSVVVRVADLQSAKPTLQMAYQNIARLRREYRHNLAHGGIFIPTPTAPEPSTEVLVILSIGEGDAQQQVMLDGVVSHVTPGDEDTPPGAGVVFGAESLSKLTEFIRSVGVLHRLPADSTVARDENFVEVDRLTADGLFLLGYVMDPVKVGQLRADCSSLPFDFDETLAALIDVGALSQEVGEMPPPGESNLSTEVDYQFQPDDIYQVLELIDYHWDRHALLAAATVADKNERYFDAEARLLSRAARVWADGLHDLRRARYFARAAVEVEPARREYQDVERRVEALVHRDAVRKIYARDFPVTSVHFVGWDFVERTVWVTTTSKLQPDRARVLGIDIRRDTIRHSETYPFALEVHPVWSRHTSIGEPPSLFRGAGRPSVVTRAGDWVFDRNPESGDDGVFVLDREGRMSTYFDGECWGIEASYDGKYIAWVAYVDGKVGAFLAEVRGADDPVQAHESEDALTCHWIHRDHTVAVYDSGSGEVFRVEPDGSREVAGSVAPSFDDIVIDSSSETAAIVYQTPSGTELSWLDVGGADVRAKMKPSVPVRQLVLRSDGCFIGTTDNGTLLGNLVQGKDHHVKGLRLVPASMQSRGWVPEQRFVAMVYRENALELVELNPKLLLE